MVKRFALLAAVLVLALGTASCKCPAQKASVAQIEGTHELVSQMLLDYVEKDPKLSEDEKQRRRTLVATDKENIQKLKAALRD